MINDSGISAGTDASTEVSSFNVLLMMRLTNCSGVSSPIRISRLCRIPSSLHQEGCVFKAGVLFRNASRCPLPSRSSGRRNAVCKLTPRIARWRRPLWISRLKICSRSLSQPSAIDCNPLYQAIRNASRISQSNAGNINAVCQKSAVCIWSLSVLLIMAQQVPAASQHSKNSNQTHHTGARGS